MPDDLDDLLRAAMKTLDEQVPSGYFEALPEQTLARLEGSMQHGSSGPTNQLRDKLTGPPVKADEAEKPVERDEDSGLHDIRNLAQSTKQRLSSRRITQNPPLSDDVLASSSGSWKNIALPQPAKMVSLPELSELPEASDVIPIEKASKASRKSKKQIAAEPVAAAPAVADEIAPTASASIERKAFSLPSQQNKRSKGPLLAVLGMGVAAAAGAVIFMQVNKDDKAASSAAKAESTTAAAAPQAEKAMVTATAIEPATGAAAGSAAPEAAPVEEAKAADAAAMQIAAPAEGQADDAEKADDDKDSARGKKAPAKPKKSAKGGTVDVEPETKVETKTDAKKPGPTAKGDGEGEPSFDALLKEAGVEEKKEAKPKLEKKSLSSDDFKKGMAGVASKAQACYKGTQGTAAVRLTVGPSGQVTKATVGGEFAGKPEAACVESAVKGAQFPPWDGGPQSFSYSYMLSD